MIGMYYNRSNAVADNDYPTNDRWPGAFVPIAVHTVDDFTDYVGLNTNLFLVIVVLG